MTSQDMSGPPVEKPHMSGPPVEIPSRRWLRTFAFDPMSTRLSGEFLTVSVPYEPDLKPGPEGELLQVVDYDPARGKWYALVNLNDPFILAQDGLKPAGGDPRSHQQIVYAVSMSVIERFERYLGRRFRFHGDEKLRIVPHAFEGRNAFFDPSRWAVLFGYYRANVEDPGPNLPNQIIFTCLSSDIIAHELTHGIVHRLRPYFSEATNADVFAWHEAFADLIALFQHFANREVVFDAVNATNGRIDKGRTLFDLASEFGQSTGRGAALRSAIVDQQRTPARFQAATEPHERGACFVAAVFDAYLDRFQAAIADLLRIATAGTGVLPEGKLHPDLVARVATEAVVTADRFLGMVVGAFDYLPPVDVTFADVIRAIVTSDHALHPDDARGLRSNLVEALRRRGIIPEKVDSLTDDALKWPSPDGPLSLRDNNPKVPLEDLILAATMDLDSAGEPGERYRAPKVPLEDPVLAATTDLDSAGEPGERYRVPNDSPVLGSKRVYTALTRWARTHAVAIGLEPSLPIALSSVHVTYRRAQDRQPLPKIVVQYTQRRPDLEEKFRPDLPAEQRTPLRAGTTLIARANGEVKYIVAKPLPLIAPAADDQDADYVNTFGQDRLDKMTAWFEQVEHDDPLSIWTDQPAVRRLDFASLHYNGEP
jgi:hypothetical protein